MSLKFGRNAPCKCGSGLKYKKCCGKEGRTEKTKYEFKSGSYGDTGSFTPSIACLKNTVEGKWDYHFVLVNPNEVFEDEASKTAESDLKEAFSEKQIHGTNSALALCLRNKGYIRVNDFKIVPQGHGFKNSNYN